MRVVLAGASGAIGVPLTRQLVAAGHEVVGLTRTPEHAESVRAVGAEPIVADVLDRDDLLRALRDRSADAVLHELTALKKTPVRHADMATTNALRTAGTHHLVIAAREMGARRFVTQSMVFGYGFGDHGDRPLTEDRPFGAPVRGRLGEHLAAMRFNEEQAFNADGIDGIALRYGLFYGSDSSTRNMIGMLRKRRLPVVRGGAGLANFVHLDDATAATVAALTKGRGGAAYNIVDGQPVRWGDFLDEAAAVFQAPRPRRIPAWLLRPAPYAHAVMTTSMRVSNARAGDELGWAPTVPNYREGLRRITAAAA